MLSDKTQMFFFFKKNGNLGVKLCKTKQNSKESKKKNENIKKNNICKDHNKITRVKKTTKKFVKLFFPHVTCCGQITHFLFVYFYFFLKSQRGKMVSKMELKTEQKG
jgi:hypothetical protein